MPIKGSQNPKQLIEMRVVRFHGVTRADRRACRHETRKNRATMSARLLSE
jgi:hypothetical protein